MLTSGMQPESGGSSGLDFGTDVAVASAACWQILGITCKLTALPNLVFLSGLWRDTAAMEREKKMRERWCLVMCKQQTKSKITETQIPLLVETQCFSGIVAALDLLDKNAPYSWLTVHTVCTTGSCTERNKCCWISGWWCSPSARNLSFWNVFNPLLSHRIDFWLFALLTRQLVAYSGPSVQCVLLLLNKASPDSPHRKTGPCLCQGRNTGEYGCMWVWLCGSTGCAGATVSSELQCNWVLQPCSSIRKSVGWIHGLILWVLCPFRESN